MDEGRTQKGKYGPTNVPVAGLWYRELELNGLRLRIIESSKRKNVPNGLWAARVEEAPNCILLACTFASI